MNPPPPPVHPPAPIAPAAKPRPQQGRWMQCWLFIPEAQQQQPPPQRIPRVVPPRQRVTDQEEQYEDVDVEDEDALLASSWATH